MSFVQNFEVYFIPLLLFIYSFIYYLCISHYILISAFLDSIMCAVRNMEINITLINHMDSFIFVLLLFFSTFFYLFIIIIIIFLQEKKRKSIDLEELVLELERSEVKHIWSCLHAWADLQVTAFVVEQQQQQQEEEDQQERQEEGDAASGQPTTDKVLNLTLFNFI